MLFYPHRELKSERQLRYRILGVTFFAHLFLFFILPYLLSFSNKVVINISRFTKSKDVAFVLSDVSRNKSRFGQNLKQNQASKNKQNKSLIKSDNKNSNRKSQELKNNNKSDKPEVKNQKIAQKKINETKKNINQKKLDIKTKKEQLKAITALAELKNKDNKKELKQDSKDLTKKKKQEIEKDKKVEQTETKAKEPELKEQKIKEIEENQEEQELELNREDELDYIDVNLADQNGLKDIVFDLKRVVSLNLKFPETFVKYMPLELSFDIDSHGKIENLVIENRLPLILKQSIKHAITKSNFAKIIWGTKNIKLVLRKTQ